MPTKRRRRTRRPADPGVVLRYADRGPYAGVPARDLTAHDLARLAYLRRYSEIAAEGKRPDPQNPDPDLVEKIKAELTGSGLYTTEG